MEIQAPRGTTDILPQDTAKWQYLENIAEKVFANYNYQEIRTPIFESTELFTRGIGEATDIVQKEMYTFEDKSQREITLRPEGTASVVRAFLENKIYGQAQPTKYFYFGPMFRYERPQTGRYRQFHQLGAEVFGSHDPAIDVEVIKLGLDILSELGLENFALHLNSIGCPECRPAYIEQLKDYLKPYLEQLCDNCQDRFERNPLRILDCKTDRDLEFMEDAPKIYDNLCSKCDDHFAQVKYYLDDLEIDYILNPRLVRGLDYYSKTAFEVIYNGLGAQDTIFGGGRYDALVEEIGDRDVPGIGFAMGIERLLLSLEEEGVELPIEEGVDIYLITIGEAARKEAVKQMYQLRAAGFKVDLDYLDRAVGTQMKAADRNNANYSIIIGENELEKGELAVKNMKSGEQFDVDIDKLVDKMGDFLK